MVELIAYKFYIETDAGFVKVVMHWLESEVQHETDSF